MMVVGEGDVLTGCAQESEGSLEGKPYEMEEGRIFFFSTTY